MALQPQSRVVLRYDVERVSDDWILSEEPVPESRLQDLVVDLLKAILAFWIVRTGRRAIVGRNLAVRWDPQHPSVGADPDLYLVEPPPPEGNALKSLLLWKDGHHAPRLAVEVVSTTRPTKDYTVAPEKYAASGCQELWIFDPELAGPHAHGGPFRLQVWSRDDSGDFIRVYAGAGPARSPGLGAWLFPIDEGQQLRIADDEAGTLWWPTAEEAERADKECEKARADEEMARADEEMARADEEMARADEEMARADEEKARAERLAERLRQLGIEP